MTNAVRKGEVAVSETSSRRWHAHLRILPLATHRGKWSHKPGRAMQSLSRTARRVAAWHSRRLAVCRRPTCLGAAYFTALSETWQITGPLVLFLGLLSLLNAPFDWASLGLTRALLRRGLELGGWWPYVLALADACLAAVIIAALALTMVVGVQAFDDLAVHGGGRLVLSLE